jgi:hypothetical protein
VPVKCEQGQVRPSRKVAEKRIETFPHMRQAQPINGRPAGLIRLV